MATIENYKKAFEQIKQWIINDYYTPAIKAEVIYDTLLSPYIAEIVLDQCGEQVQDDLQLVAKEMSVRDPEENDEQLLGSKIDYVLADREKSYMIELKTTDGSFDKNQADLYLKNVGKSFGEVLGNKLLRILKRKNSKYACSLSEKLLDGMSDSALADVSSEMLENMFADIMERHGKGIDPNLNSYADKARALLHNKNWASTEKYLYTLGQIIDYLERGNTLWQKPMALIYLTPDGRLGTSRNIGVDDWYVAPANTQCVSLIKAVDLLRSKEDDPVAQMLADIIENTFRKAK
ncbi:MAG: hypothetical protein HDQ87_05280 [Clostridia bacterium]|nr:hypothetical protein [Clostridia bacterium]